MAHRRRKLLSHQMLNIILLEKVFFNITISLTNLSVNRLLTYKYFIFIISEITDDDLTTLQLMSGAHWPRNSILSLIAVYNEQFEKLRNCGNTNSKIWANISNTLNGKNESFLKFNANQCKYKFSKLKAKYQKVKDARGPNNTGGKAVKFEYFEELNEIFGESHSNFLPGAQSSLEPKQISRQKIAQSEHDTETNITHSEGNPRQENIIAHDQNGEQNQDMYVDDDPDVTDVLTPVPRKPKRKTVGDQLKESVNELLTMKKLHHEEKQKQIDQIIEIEKTHNQILEKLVDKM